MEKVVGNGAFGIVWRAREEGSSGGPVAIKKVILDRRYHNRELEMMKGMEHECANPNLALALTLALAIALALARRALCSPP